LLIPDPARLSCSWRTKTHCIGCIHCEPSGRLFYLWRSKQRTRCGLFVCRNWMLKFFIWWRQRNKGGRDYASLCVFVEAWTGEILCQTQQASLLEMNTAALILLRSLDAHSKLKLYQGRHRYFTRLGLKVTNTKKQWSLFSLRFRFRSFRCSCKTWEWIVTGYECCSESYKTGFWTEPKAYILLKLIGAGTWVSF
jgi:hypothetical protein